MSGEYLTKSSPLKKRFGQISFHSLHLKPTDVFKRVFFRFYSGVRNQANSSKYLNWSFEIEKWIFEKLLLKAFNWKTLFIHVAMKLYFWEVTIFEIIAEFRYFFRRNYLWTFLSYLNDVCTEFISCCYIYSFSIIVGCCTCTVDN